MVLAPVLVVEFGVVGEHLVALVVVACLAELLVVLVVMIVAFGYNFS